MKRRKKLNVSTNNKEMIFARINSYEKELIQKYRHSDDCDFEHDKFKTTFILFSKLDGIFQSKFKFNSDVMMINDEHIGDDTIITNTYTDTFISGGCKFDELPDGSVVLMWSLKNNRIDVLLNRESCAYLEIMGPTAICPAFNEEQFKGNPIFDLICTNIMTVMAEVMNDMMKPVPKGSTNINVSDTINVILRKWINDCDEEEMTNLRYAFCGMIQCVEDILIDVHDRYTDWLFISPNNKEIEERYMKLYLMEEDSHYIENGLDAACIPDSICSCAFSLEPMAMIQISFGIVDALTIWIKDGKPRIRVDEVPEEIEQSEKYKTIISKLKEKYDECFNNE